MGRPTIALRFIAGLRSEIKKSRRDGRNRRAGNLPRSFVPAGLGRNLSAPSDESLGYILSPGGLVRAEFHWNFRRTAFENSAASFAQF
jgi:hypothetical protein